MHSSLAAKLRKGVIAIAPLAALALLADRPGIIAMILMATVLCTLIKNPQSLKLLLSAPTLWKAARKEVNKPDDSSSKPEQPAG